jgi:hypothetical protein
MRTAAMKPDRPGTFRYQPRYCTFVCDHVWAIRTKQPDGAWKPVNCLDKDEACAKFRCAFTTPLGEWPFPPPVP